jgi:hypothetical protein
MTPKKDDRSLDERLKEGVRRIQQDSTQEEVERQDPPEVHIPVGRRVVIDHQDTIEVHYLPPKVSKVTYDSEDDIPPVETRVPMRRKVKQRLPKTVLSPGEIDVLSRTKLQGHYQLGPGTYRVNFPIQVPEGAFLEILPGVRFVFLGNGGINVYGGFSALGEPGRQIVFEDSGMNGWEGIFIQNGENGARIANAVISGIRKQDYYAISMEESDLTLERVVFKDFPQGALSGTNGNLTIQECEFRGLGRDSRESGVLSLEGISLRILKSRFVNCQSPEAGILMASEGDIEIEGCEFIDNYGVSGVLVLQQVSGVHSASNLFRGNANTAVYLEGCSDADFQKDKIEGNRSDFGGGLYICSGSEIGLYGLFIRNNRAAFGGGMMIQESSVYGDNNRFESNQATEVGGGILAIDSDLELSIGIFSMNRARSGGGVAYAGEPPRILNTSFLVNSPENSPMALPNDYELPEEAEVPYP